MSAHQGALGVPWPPSGSGGVLRLPMGTSGFPRATTGVRPSSQVRRFAKNLSKKNEHSSQVDAKIIPN